MKNMSKARSSRSLKDTVNTPFKTFVFVMFVLGMSLTVLFPFVGTAAAAIFDLDVVEGSAFAGTTWVVGEVLF